MNDPRERDDADLVVAALNRDERAFSELMRRHKDSLYRFVRSYVGDASEAYDLVQESFVSAWAALSRFERQRPFAVWLRRIALNKCRDWTRRRKVRAFFYEARPLDSPSSLAVSSDADDPSDVEASRLGQLEQAIANLPTSLKEPLLLTTLDGMSHSEAASLLNLTPKAIEVRVYRAKRAVARALNLPDA